MWEKTQGEQERERGGERTKKRYKEERNIQNSLEQNLKNQNPSYGCECTYPCYTHTHRHTHLYFSARVINLTSCDQFCPHLWKFTVLNNESTLAKTTALFQNLVSCLLRWQFKASHATQKVVCAYPISFIVTNFIQYSTIINLQQKVLKTCNIITNWLSYAVSVCYVFLSL